MLLVCGTYCGRVSSLGLKRQLRFRFSRKQMYSFNSGVFKLVNHRAGEVGRQWRALAAPAGDWSLAPNTHIGQLTSTCHSSSGGI